MSIRTLVGRSPLLSNPAVSSLRRAALLSVSEAVEGCRRTGWLERQFALAGQTIQIATADAALAAPLLRGLDHHPATSAPAPDLRISVLTGAALDAWEVVEAAFADDFPPPAENDETNPVWFYQDERFTLECQPFRQRFSLLDSERAEATVYLPDSRQLTMRDRANPLRAVLYWWLRASDIQMVHAAALGTADGGVLIAGRSGSGKSTTALACLQSGLRYLGDDHVLVEPGSAPKVHNLYCSAALHHADLRARFDHLRTAQADDPADPKSLLYLPASEVIPCTPLRAVLVPVIRPGAAHTVERISPAACLAALAPSTVMQLPGAGESDFRRIAQVAAAVPGYRLHLTPDLATIPDLISDVLAQLADVP